MKFEIKNWYTGGIIFTVETDSWKLAVEAAIKAKTDLRSADLSSADLRSANLRSADLRSADLSSADLRSADLRSADLSSADLSSADLRSANLSYADLSEKQLRIFRDDIWAVLSSSAMEVQGLKQALVEGKVDGLAYKGECACLVGTIAKVANKNYENLDILKPDSSRPAEIYFMLIKKGDTPKKSKFSKQAIEWIDEWLENMQFAFGAKIKKKAVPK